jgi:ABC-type lipopolysaccharide transport system, ATPase component, putative
VSQINNAKLKLQVSVRDQEEQILAFADSQNNPVILVNRQDIKDDDVSAKDSATGLIQRNGSWKISQS